MIQQQTLLMQMDVQFAIKMAYGDVDRAIREMKASIEKYKGAVQTPKCIERISEYEKVVEELEIIKQSKQRQ